MGDVPSMLAHENPRTATRKEAFRNDKEIARTACFLRKPKIMPLCIARHLSNVYVFSQAQCKRIFFSLACNVFILMQALVAAIRPSGIFQYDRANVTNLQTYVSFPFSTIYGNELVLGTRRLLR